MKNIKNYILFTLFLCIGNVFGQVSQYNTKIKDGSVSNTTSVPSSNAILELESTSKGLLLPRMTDIQRDVLKNKLTNQGNGLTIYNTSTDCINYWSVLKNEWLSVCGTLPPAVVEIDPAQCSNIKIVPSEGSTLLQGKFLTPQDILFVDVYVSAIGVYDISATTENGYYFSGSGTFMNTGSMRIALTGVGTPIKGYDTAANGSTTGIGDVVTFFINGKKATNQCNFKAFVKKAAIEYIVVCTSVFTAQGQYLIGVPVNQSENYVDIKLNVTQPGTYRIKSTAYNGVSFSGSGRLESAGNNITVRLYAEGTPTVAGVSSLSIETNSNTNPISTCKIGLTIAAVDYSVDLSKSIHKGEFMQNSTLSDQTLIIAVNVKKPGQASFKLESAGVSFSADNISLELKDVSATENIQYVTLVNNKAVLPLQNELLISGPINDTKYTNTYSIPLKVQPVNYTVDCASIKVNTTNSIYVPGMAMTANNTVTLNVNVKAIGEYDIKTNVVNGVFFQATGTFAKTGIQEVVLKASGTPLEQMPNVQYFIYTNSVNQQTTMCNFKITFKYYDINILVVGSSVYGPNKNTGYSLGRMLSAQSNFGPSGIVKVNSINIFNVGVVGTDSALQTLIDRNKIDMIFVVVGGRVYGTALDRLSKFAKEDKGIVVYSLENYESDFITFIGNVDPTATGTRFETRYTMINPVVSSIPSDFAKSSFGDLTSKRFGNDATNGSYFSNMGANIQAIASRDNDANWFWAGKHKDHGVFFVGDGGWMIGTTSNTSNVIYPTVSDISGKPIPKLNYGLSNSQGDVYNSLLFMNIMEWSIKYLLGNKLNK